MSARSDAFDPRGVRRWLGALLAALGAQAISFVAMPHVPLRGIAGFWVTFALVVGAVLWTAALAPAVRARWALTCVPAGLGLGAVAYFAPGPKAVLPVLCVTALLLGGGSLAGAVVGARIRHPGYLMVVAYVSAIADMHSVFSPQGVTAAVVESEVWLSVLAVSWPLPGTSEASPLLGVGDVVMTAVYLVAARQLHIGPRRTAVALAAAYACVGLLLVVLEHALPALPVLGLAVVLAHPEVRTLPRKDRPTAVVGSLLLTLLFVLLAWAPWRHVPPG